MSAWFEEPDRIQPRQFGLLKAAEIFTSEEEIYDCAKSFLFFVNSSVSLRM